VRLFLCCSVTLIFLLVVCAVPGRAQDQASPQKKSCVVYTIQDLSTGRETADFATPITASISAAIEVSGFQMVPADVLGREVQESTITPRALQGESTILTVARALSADLAVSGFYVVRDEQIVISLQCWDVQAGRLVTGLQEKARFNLAFYSFLHDHVAQMIQRIQLRQEPAAAGTGSKGTLTEIAFLSADEGMEIRLAGDLSIGTVTDGKLLWRPDGIRQETNLLVEKRKPGYHTAWQTVRAQGEIQLSKLEKEYMHGREVDWTWGQLAGLGTTYRAYAKPDELFVSLGSYLFIQPPMSSAGSPVYHADLNLGLGGYLFFPPDFPVRLGISSGAGMVITMSGGGVLPPAVDLYLNVMSWWIETSLLGPVIFLRQELKFALGVGYNYLGTQWITAAGLPPMTLGVMFRW
jgi:hypothetical protein